MNQSQAPLFNRIQSRMSDTPRLHLGNERNNSSLFPDMAHNPQSDAIYSPVHHSFIPGNTHSAWSRNNNRVAEAVLDNARVTGNSLPAISMYIDFTTLKDIYYDGNKLELKTDSEGLAFVTKNKGKPIKTIGEWLSAWAIFFKTFVFFFPSQATNLIEYQSLIINWSNQYSFSRIFAYDRSFRIRLPLDPSASWNRVDENLFNQHLRGAPGPNSYACFGCGASSHPYKDCPLISSKSLSSSNSKFNKPNPTTKNSQSTPNDANSLGGICYNYNLNKCPRGSACPFTHHCWFCYGNHRGSDCLCKDK